MINKLYTSESVGKGHPDKICDQIADLILDACLKDDKHSRVACEVLASNRLIVIGGEITTKSYVDVVKIAWQVLKPLGYNENDFTILSNINQQSSDLNKIVNKNELGAGDQGVMYGYATNKTPQAMPLSIVLAHDLIAKATYLIDSKKFKHAKYDMKSEVTIDWSTKTPKIHTMLMSIQHESNINLQAFKQYVIKNIMNPVAIKYKLGTSFNKMVNNGGNFVIGGPMGDTGLTGRKIMVDTYGTVARHGGGAFSGKDYTKVDRTGAYLARYIAVNIVAAKLADRCEIQLTYAIGQSQPLSICIDTFNTNHIPTTKIYYAINKVFNLNLNYVIKQFKLDRPIYSKLSVLGHFGRLDLNLPWEKTNRVEALLKATK